MEKERLARVEEKIDSLSDVLKEFIQAQKKHNEAFYVSRDEVIKIQANARGAWWTIGVFGTLTVAVSSLVSGLVVWFKG